MIEISTTETVNDFHRILRLVDKGQSVRILNHGRVRARLVPDSGFMTGKEAARLFAGFHATKEDVEAANAIKKNLMMMRKEEQNALDH